MYKEPLFLNFREIVCYCAKEYKDKTAFIIKNPDGTYLNIGFSELKERYYRLCGFFLKQGLRGERIAVIGKNSFDWVLSYLAASTVGVVVPLDVELHEKDVTNFINAAECKAICYAEGASEKISSDMDIQRFSFEDVRKLSDPKNGEFCGYREIDAIEIKKDEMRVLIF